MKIDEDYYEVSAEPFKICGDEGIFHMFQKKDKSDAIVWIEVIKEEDEEC